MVGFGRLHRGNCFLQGRLTAGHKDLRARPVRRLLLKFRQGVRLVALSDGGE